eukprot:scaffold2183_cov55-Phaeocystis_antarctica.AAC.2
MRQTVRPVMVMPKAADHAAGSMDSSCSTKASSDMPSGTYIPRSIAMASLSWRPTTPSASWRRPSASLSLRRTQVS